MELSSADSLLLPVSQNDHNRHHPTSKARIIRARERHRCLECQNRRIKCDMLSPCSVCVKSGRLCIPPDNSHLITRAGGRVKGKQRVSLSDKAEQRLEDLEIIIDRLVSEGHRSLRSGKNGIIEDKDVGEEDRARLLEPAAGSFHNSAFQRMNRGNRVALHPGIRGKSSHINPSSWMALNHVDDGLIDEALCRGDITCQSRLSDGNQSTPPTSRFDALSSAGSGDIPFNMANSLIFPAIRESMTVEEYYPPARSHVVRLVELFVAKVDPFIRIIHKPTFYIMLDKFLGIFYGGGVFEALYTGQQTSTNLAPDLPTANFDTRSFHTLLFCIFYAVTVSLDESTFQRLFPGSFTTCRMLSARYRKATELALANANVIVTDDLVVLQSLTLLLAVGTRDTEARADWVLLGMAIRIAQAMGLHRDGEVQGLNSLETETRRRVWTKLRFLDVRAAEAVGREPSIREGSFDTLLPSNTDDDNIPTPVNGGEGESSGASILAFGTEDAYPSGSSISNAARSYDKSHFTEMTFSLIRYELIESLSEQLGSKYGKLASGSFGEALASEKEQKLKSIDELQNQIEKKYGVRYWDMSDSIQRLAWRIISTQLAKVRFMIDVQQSQVMEDSSESRVLEETRAFMDAIIILEETIALRDDARALNSQWYIRSCTQFHATALILFQLARGVVPSDAFLRAWQVIDRLYGLSESHALNKSSDEQTDHQVHCACAPCYGQNIAEDVLSRPLGRLLALASAKRFQSHTSSDSASPNISNNTHDTTQSLAIPESEPGLPDMDHISGFETISAIATDSDGNFDANLGSDWLGDALMDWIRVDGRLTNEETSFGHSFDFTSF